MSLANCALRAWAFLPLSRWKSEPLLPLPLPVEGFEVVVVLSSLAVLAPVLGVPADPLPVNPPVAPVAAMRASASAVVVQVIEVPAELTKGRAAQVRGAAPQEVVTNLPPTHCANWVPTQAFSPSKVSG